MGPQGEARITMVVDGQARMVTGNLLQDAGHLSAMTIMAQRSDRRDEDHHKIQAETRTINAALEYR
jgi:hypothetical protein